MTKFSILCLPHASDFWDISIPVDFLHPRLRHWKHLGGVCIAIDNERRGEEFYEMYLRVPSAPVYVCRLYTALENKRENGGE